ncbi:CPBP family intramembrane glutamic endopeptidase [Bacillus gobiensis]|uniref:CPBP family intramembrane glutamic endopeptidase n=1 Tax=Bacillus gobiensis TaxID=1441095 RepID=UPI003D1AA6F9
MPHYPDLLGWVPFLRHMFFALRLRSGASFGIRRTTGRWLLAGVGFGVGVFLLGRLTILIMVYTGFTDLNTQASYQSASTGGTLALIFQLLMIAVLTPLGEEFAFRGVLTNALQKYGPWASIFGSAIVFATAHGINEVWRLAFFVGVSTGYLFYRTGSVWSCVIVHAVFNGLGTLYTAFAVNYLM